MTVLTTERLFLRPLQAQDADAIVAEINVFEIARNLARVPFPYAKSDADAFITWAQKIDSRSAIFAVEEKSHPGTLVGIISYESSAEKQDAELGYWYARRVWGQGYASEAGRAVVWDALHRAGHTKLVSCYHNDNPASGRVLENIGFKAVGQCCSFSLAQNCEVQVTNMVLTREAPNQKTSRT